VVEDVSSIIGDAFEGKATIQANHMEMCRFADRNGPDYQLVSGVVRRWSRTAVQLSVKQDPDHNILSQRKFDKQIDSNQSVCQGKVSPS
jgi:hypothetical protein